MKTSMEDRLQRIERMSFTRNHASAQWIDGMMLGNGDIGAMVWGPPTRRNLTINKTDVWDYRVPNGKSCMPSEPLEEIRRIVAAGDKEAFFRLAKETTAASAAAFPTIQPCATALIEIAPGTQTWNYEERLSISTAEMRCSYKPFDRLWSRADPVRETTLVCATRPVIAMQVECGDGKIHGHRIGLSRNTNAYLAAPEGGCHEDAIWIVMRFPDGLINVTAASWAGVQAHAFAAGDQAFARLQGGGSGEDDWLAARESFQGTRGELAPDPAPAPHVFSLFLTTTRGYDEDAVLAEALRNLDEARQAGFEALQREHRQWWRDFWSRGYIEIDRPAAERLWYFGQYLLGSSSRPGHQAAALQGVWSNQDAPPWNSDYHSDINIQANYWSCHVSDRVEFAEPYFRIYEHMAIQARRDTEAYYGSKGLKFPMGAGPDGHELVGHVTCKLWPGGTAWLLLHFWWHYRHTLDRDWLREHAWPLLVDALQYYEDYLLPDEKGGLKVFPSYSPEQGGNCPESLGTNSTADLSMIKALLRAALAAADVLEADDEIKNKWRGMLKALPEYPTIALPYSEPGKWNVRFKDMEERDFDFQTAHLPQTLAPVYPCGEVTAWSDNETLRKTAIATFDRWRWRTGSRPAGGFAGEFGGFVQARLAMPSALGDLEQVALRHVFADPRQEFKTFFRGGPDRNFMQIDWILGFPGPVMECLLQSHDGIRLFPAVDSGFTGRFEGFRAEGAFRVSAEMRDGVVVRAEIESLAGGVCRIHNPWPSAQVSLNGKPSGVASDAVLSVPLQAGDAVSLRSGDADNVGVPPRPLAQMSAQGT